jgi:hypothetical protein
MQEGFEAQLAALEAKTARQGEVEVVFARANTS